MKSKKKLFAVASKIEKSDNCDNYRMGNKEKKQRTDTKNKAKMIRSNNSIKRGFREKSNVPIAILEQSIFGGTNIILVDSMLPGFMTLIVYRKKKDIFLQFISFHYVCLRKNT